jgi:5-formyltetrahydrofolate cyclo-ligase
LQNKYQDIHIIKKQIRNDYKAKRLLLTKEEIDFKSNLITQNFIKFFNDNYYYFDDDLIFSLYFAINNEVDSSKIANFLVNQKFTISYPRIIAHQQPLDFVEFNNQNVLLQSITKSKIIKNIDELNGSRIVVPDIIIAPLVAFDDNFNRIGMGGGFFDRTIASLRAKNRNLKFIGLAYHLQRYENIIPYENGDQRLDVIITEKNILLYHSHS